MVDVEHGNVAHAGFRQGGHQIGRQLVAGFGVNLARLVVDQVRSDVGTEDELLRHQDFLQAGFFQFLDGAYGELGAGFGNRFTGFRIHQVERRFLAFPGAGIEPNRPTLFAVFEMAGGVEGIEDGLVIQTDGAQDGRRRQFAAAVDAHMHDVFRVELEIQPRATVGDDPRAIEEFTRRVRLAMVMVEEHARRTVHLRHDHTLGAVDGEGTVLGHERNVAHVHVLLLDVLDLAGAGIGIHHPDDQAQRYAQRRSEVDATLTALIHVVFRTVEFVTDIFQRRSIAEVLDGEYRFEHGMQAGALAVFHRHVHLQELLIRVLLNFDEVRQRRRREHGAEIFADALPRGEGVLIHVCRLSHGFPTNMITCDILTRRILRADPVVTRNQVA